MACIAAWSSESVSPGTEAAFSPFNRCGNGCRGGGCVAGLHATGFAALPRIRDCRDSNCASERASCALQCRGRSFLGVNYNAVVGRPLLAGMDGGNLRQQQRHVSTSPFGGTCCKASVYLWELLEAAGVDAARASLRALTMTSANMTGTLPAALSDLTALRYVQSQHWRCSPPTSYNLGSSLAPCCGDHSADWAVPQTEEFNVKYVDVDPVCVVQLPHHILEHRASRFPSRRLQHLDETYVRRREAALEEAVYDMSDVLAGRWRLTVTSLGAISCALWCRTLNLALNSLSGPIPASVTTLLGLR